MQNIEDHHSKDDWRSRAAILGLDEKNWLRTREAEQYSGLRATRLYELTPHEIKSFLLKRDQHALRGVRLWSRSSIDAYLNKKFEEALAAGNRPAPVSWAKEKEA